MVDKKTEEQELKDIISDERSFLFEDQKYYIDNADLADIKAADWRYSITYNEAFTAGVATAAQMEDILEQRNVLGKEYEEKRMALATDLEEKATMLDAMNPEDDIEAYKVLTNEVEDLRRQLLRHNQKASMPLAQSCEQLSEDARIEFLTSAMVKDSEGKRVWKDYEDYKTSSNVGLSVFARYHVMLYLQGMSSDFMERTEEAVARKKLEAYELKQLESETETKTQPATKSKTSSTKTAKARDKDVPKSDEA